ncbi:SAV_915 family protein [Phytomonospora endophytica]|uniref:Uncharacterized protein n=1 Tax=Phytomonospora endophytica TaxID=714109 RepID=A0A841G230_9ACTN|nr:SAV_915 family protein [Phytomonospora endophytica]MBB6039707.1 hypothetical protein [Phytomonospora endophytica]GIG70957.1 hypothetical protein Pen01_72520 [Phytomonospora endophytica]
MDDPDHVRYVPVRPARLVDAVVVRTGRLPDGGRVGIAFSRLDLLAAAMGDSQRWIRLSDSALRSMLTPLGITRTQLDPVLVAPDISTPSRPTETRSRAGAERRPALAARGSRA